MDPVAAYDPKFAPAEGEISVYSEELFSSYHHAGKDGPSGADRKQADASFDRGTAEGGIGAAFDFAFREDADDMSLAESGEGLTDGADRHALPVNSDRVESPHAPSAPAFAVEFDACEPTNLSWPDAADTEGVKVADVGAGQEVAARGRVFRDPMCANLHGLEPDEADDE